MNSTDRSQNLTNWSKLDSRWRELAQRDDRGNSSSNGQIWGVPYRWGTTVIIYRRDKLTEANIPIPQDWADLWNPQLRQRISLLDRSREVIGLTLKKLGYSYNTTDLDRVPNLKAELAKLHQQVKSYSADRYLQPLVIGETWVAVGWSLDAMDLIQRIPILVRSCRVLARLFLPIFGCNHLSHRSCRLPIERYLAIAIDSI
ncbi:MAG: extracellular solute-binding protein [Chamaesiphon sp. CSU_1_12]|nr:extracellular solute-binding protein [Chamaesiphon sp. CSU_1_12]